jgi:hypothetical protein
VATSTTAGAHHCCTLDSGLRLSPQAGHRADTRNSTLLRNGLARGCRTTQRTAHKMVEDAEQEGRSQGSTARPHPNSSDTWLPRTLLGLSLALLDTLGMPLLP